MQELFLRAFVSVDRLRDPDRFGGRAQRLLRRATAAPLTLLPGWPEPLHPPSAEGLPSPDDPDRADAVREAVAGLLAGQRRAVPRTTTPTCPPSPNYSRLGAGVSGALAGQPVFAPDSAPRIREPLGPALQCRR